MSRSTANTRLRDFYDLYILTTQQIGFSIEDLKEAFTKTCNARGTTHVISDAELILDEIRTSKGLQGFWSNYQRKFDYARAISWDEVMESVEKLWKHVR